MPAFFHFFSPCLPISHTDKVFVNLARCHMTIFTIVRCFLICISHWTMSTATVARRGRHRQRYEDDFRLVAGCIPYRRKLENHSVEFVDMLEVLMISSPNRSDLVFPKGGWEIDETVGEAACREALEEAGVRGIIHDTSLGVWEFRSKSGQKSCNLEGSCRGYMFALEVTEELESWPEQAEHNRRWVSVSEALQLCRYDWMREALHSCLRVLSSKPSIPVLEISEPSSSIFRLMRPSNSEIMDSVINTFC